MGIAARKGKGRANKGGLSARKKSSFDYKSIQQRLSGDTRQNMDKLKPMVFTRDRYTCRSCGQSAHQNPDLRLTCDHVIPVSNGGRTILANLITLCIDCHIKKLGSKNRRGAKLLKGLKNRLDKERFG